MIIVCSLVNPSNIQVNVNITPKVVMIMAQEAQLNELCGDKEVVKEDNLLLR